MQQYIMKYWRDVFDSKQKPDSAVYAEGGPLPAEELQGEWCVAQLDALAVTPCKDGNLCCFLLRLHCRYNSNIISLILLIY